MPDSAITPLSKANPLYRLVVLTIGHTAVDAYANVIGPLMIVFAARGIFSEDNAKLLPAIMAAAGSLTQPLVGLLADRGVPRSVLLAGPAFAAGGVCLAMLAGSPALVIACLIVAGLGVAVFHPEAAVLATLGVRRHPALAMSVFLSAGALGLWLGPLACGFLLDRTTVAMAAGLLAIPGLALGLFLSRSSIARVQPEPTASGDVPPASLLPAANQETSLRLRINWPLASLTTQATLRAMAVGAVAVVVPWWGKEHHASMSQIGNLSGLFLFSGGIGMLLVSWLCPLHRHRHLLIVTSLLGILPVVLLAWADTLWQAMACVVIGGLLTNGVNAVIVSTAQRVAPRGARTASALTMGFAWGLGGGAGPLLVWAVGSNTTALLISAAALLPAGLLAAALPVAADTSHAFPAIEQERKSVNQPSSSAGA